MRRQIFLKNYREIQKINAEGHPYKLGVNKFANLTDEEYAKYYLNANPIPESIQNQESNYIPDTISIENDDIDWVREKKVTPVRDQGMCGSCWTFGTISMIETLYAIKGNNLTEFSEQQLVDCCRIHNSNGCKGGDVEDAVQYLKDEGNILAADYPYKAIEQKCDIDKFKKIKTVSNYAKIPKGNTNMMQNALHNGSMYVSVNANAVAFKFYKSGIVTNGCPHEIVSHGVTLVGSGVDKKANVNFWKVRNSWGENWGDDGYIRIKRELGDNVLGVCGIGRHAVYPIRSEEHTSELQ